MSATKLIIIILVGVGFTWPPAFILAALVYVFVVRQGSELLGYWLFKDKPPNKWD